MGADTTTRLVRCFSLVFPDLDPAEIPQAAVASVAAWDSLATVTLVAVIEEEFGIQIEPDDVVELISFELTCDYLAQRVSANGS
jgi:acyl carrier protein